MITDNRDAMMRSRRFIPPAWAPDWALAWGVCLLFALLALAIPLPTYRMEYTRITDRLGIPLWVIVYAPEPAKFQPAPAAVVCQPINDSPEYGRLLDLELIQDGFVVLTFDWRGRMPEEDRQRLRVRTQQTLRSDLLAAVDHLRAMPGVDPTKIVVAGHSVGGSLAIETGMADPTIAAVASLGMEADVSPTQPRNLLWAVGLYDEFRVSLDHMRRVFRESAGTQALEDTTVGDFARGTARRLGLSPASDHFTELQDWRIHREVLNWFRRAVGLPNEARGLRMETRGLLLVVAWLAAMAGLFLTLRRFACGRPDRVRILRAAAAAALLGMALLCRVRGSGFLQASNGVFVLFVFAFFAGLVSSLDSATFERTWRFGVRAGLVFWASLLMTFMVLNIPYYIQTPRYLAMLPEFAARHLLDLADGYLLNYPRPIMFAVYDPQQLVLKWWVYAVMVAVIIAPDGLTWAVARLRRRRDKPATARVRVSPVSVVLLAVLLVFLASVVSLRLAQGFLTGESARAALTFILRFTVLPVFLFAVLWRWTAKRNYE